MHYQTRILPIDGAGHFLLVICFGQHPIGGEDTRETAYARLAVGHIDRPHQLEDVTELCTLPRPACAAEAEYHRRMAQGQGELAGGGRSTGLQARRYRDNQQRSLHSAWLAGQDGRFIPRQVLASPSGRVLLAYESLPSSGAAVFGALRLLDLPNRRVLLDASSSRLPIVSGGERLSCVQLGRPLGLSLDGTRVLLPGSPRPDSPLVECRLESGLPEVANWPAQVHYLATPRGWLDLTRRPPKSFAHGACWAAEKLALVGDNGDAWVVEEGRNRHFFPHRGLKRGTFVALSLSECGQWLASLARGQLVVTRLADGASWAVAQLLERLHQDLSQGNYLVRSTVPPAFSFIGSRLLVAQDGEVRPLDLSPPRRVWVSECGRPGARSPIAVPLQAPFARLVKAARLERVSAQLMPHFSPALRLQSKAVKKEGPPGRSRLGGWPDLPIDVQWPCWRGLPMAFLAQVDLAEAHAVEPRLRLPRQGLLSFFLGEGELALGTEKSHGEGWRVVWSQPDQPLRRLTCSPAPRLYQTCALKLLKGGLALPDENSLAYHQIDLDESQRDDYNELLALLSPDEAGDQLLGFPNLIQGHPPELLCELASAGLDPWGPEEPNDEIRRSASERGLLLQLTSNSEADFMWGDGGHLYFYGRRAAMEVGDFSQVWVTIES